MHVLSGLRRRHLSPVAAQLHPTHRQPLLITNAFAAPKVVVADMTWQLGPGGGQEGEGGCEAPLAALVVGKSMGQRQGGCLVGNARGKDREGRV